MNGTNQAFPQVLLGVWNDHCFARDGAFENVVRTGDTNKCPALPLKAPNDVAPVFQHEAPPIESMMEG
jgi:hypothetical protein